MTFITKVNKEFTSNESLYYILFLVSIILFSQDSLAAQQKIGILQREVEQENQILRQVQNSCQQVLTNIQVVEDESVLVNTHLQAVSTTKEQIQSQVKWSYEIGWLRSIVIVPFAFWKSLKLWNFSWNERKYFDVLWISTVKF